VAADLLIDTDKLALFDPVLNLTAGPAICHYVLKIPTQGRHHAAGDRLQCRAGQSRKFRASANYEQDPLLFMESIPWAETRQFIERVLTNYWLYRTASGRDPDAGRGCERRLADLQDAGRDPQTAAVPNGTY